MYIDNVPEKFYKRLQRKYNFLGIETSEMAELKENFIELYERFLKSENGYEYAYLEMCEELRKLKKGHYVINENSIEIRKGILKGLTIKNIKFIKEFNIKTIKEFSYIVAGTREYIISMFKHLPEFVEQLLTRHGDFLHIIPEKKNNL